MCFVLVGVVKALPPTITSFVCPSGTTVALGQSVACTITATDDQGSYWVDRYCQYDASKSPTAYYPDGPYAEYASRGWSSAQSSGSSYTASCPISDRGQWPVAGTYTMRWCVTDDDADDPDYPNGKLGWAYPRGYSVCQQKTITVFNDYRFEFAPVDPTDDQDLTYSTTNPRSKVLYWRVTYTPSPSDPTIDGNMVWTLNNFDTGALVSQGTISFTGLSGVNTFNTPSGVSIRNGYNYSWQIVLTDEYSNVVASRIWRFQVQGNPASGPQPELINERHMQYDGSVWARPSGYIFDEQDITHGYVDAVVDYKSYRDPTRLCFWWWNANDPTMKNSCQNVGVEENNVATDLSWVYQEDPHYGINYYWQYTMDDWVHNQVSTELMDFSVAPSGNQPPVLKLNSPSADYVFPQYSRNITLSATVNDTDDLWVDIVFLFDQSNIPKGSMKRLCVYTANANTTRTCTIPTEYLFDGSDYRWCVQTNDKTVTSRTVEECRYFSIFQDVTTPLPILDSVVCDRDTVGINQTTRCKVTGHDNTASAIYLDLYCQYNSQISPHAIYDFNYPEQSENAEYASAGWQKINAQSGSYTFTCPNSLYTPFGQWQTTGDKTVVGCITNGNYGFNSTMAYSVCSAVTVNVQSYPVYGGPESLELPVDTTELLTQFYNGMITFFGKFFMPFLIFVGLLAFVLTMFAIYEWVKSQ